jgi:predicted PhzF superfamily epimerase YddE/YHI9
MPFDIDQILDGNRDPVQGSADVPLAAFTVETLGISKRFLAKDGRERMKLSVLALDPGKTLLHQGLG